MKFCSSGLWGIGSYFAVNFAYSHQYRFTMPGEVKRAQMFVAKVLVGDVHTCPSDANLRMPPKKPNTPQSGALFEEDRYDCVSGVTRGSTVYIIYDNGRAYPFYLVTYAFA
jgi:hypothetical protein